MEKGSFHTSPEPVSFTAQADEIVKNIPLPNQLPAGVNFRDLPPTALKSSTLESLISQNEDLMARLSVALRKANMLEEKTAILEKDNQSYEAKFQTLKEQYLVLHEKDRLFSSRSQQLLTENGNVKAHQQKLEKVYSELYVQAQGLQRRLQHLERYRSRVKKASAGIQARAKKLPALESEYAQVRKTMAASHQQTVTSHQQTVNSYEAKLSEVRKELDNFRGKAGERDTIFEQKMKLENQLVYEQRQSKMIQEDLSMEVARLGDETASLRMQLKESLLIQESQRQEIADLTTDMPALKDQNQALLEQVESLQALWAHKQRELEQLEEKNGSLQKLNQSLSVNLNQQRKEYATLQTETDAERFSLTDKIKILEDEIQMLRSERATPAPAAES